MILRIFRMLSRCAAEIHTLPVNQEYSLNILLLKDYWGLHSYRRDAQMGSQIFGIHPVFQETFLHIHKLPLQLRILKNWILRYLGCTQRQCEVSQDIVNNYRTMFESRISAGRSEKLPFSSYFFMVVWHGGSCKEVCGTILWVGKQDDSATLQSIYFMYRWPPLQRGRNKICWRIVKYMLSNCSEMFLFGKNWTTWYFMVSKQARTCHNKTD